MKQNIQELREKMLEDYKIAVLECLYYTNSSSYKEDEIKQISKEYKINFTDDYRIFMQQFENFKIEDLEYIQSLKNKKLSFRKLDDVLNEIDNV